MWAFSMIKAGLWLAAGLVSALLVYWLHFKPVYEEHWTSAAGSVVCAGLVDLCGDRLLEQSWRRVHRHE